MFEDGGSGRRLARLTCPLCLMTTVLLDRSKEFSGCMHTMGWCQGTGPAQVPAPATRHLGWELVAVFTAGVAQRMRVFWGSTSSFLLVASCSSPLQGGFGWANPLFLRPSLGQTWVSPVYSLSLVLWQLITDSRPDLALECLLTNWMPSSSLSTMGKSRVPCLLRDCFVPLQSMGAPWKSSAGAALLELLTTWDAKQQAAKQSTVEMLLTAAALQWAPSQWKRLRTCSAHWSVRVSQALSLQTLSDVVF